MKVLFPLRKLQGVEKCQLQARTRRENSVKSFRLKEVLLKMNRGFRDQCGSG